jgi:CheY-like chemotaxis protein
VDTGIGIAKEKHEDIFESFTQADGSTTRKYGGTGLGTAICKKIVEMMGGEIGVESEQGKGSTFWFTVPYEISEAPSDNEQAAGDSELGNNQSKAMRGARILVAEDYEPNQEVVRMHLGNEGHTIEIAPNGKIAVEMCIKNKYDLVLMDVQMPELDGIDATKLIRSGGSLSHDVPVIGLTASTSIDTRRACLEAGMNDIIHKPIRRKHLLSTTNKWLSRSSEDASAGDDQAQAANTDNPLDFELAVEEFGGKKEVVVDVICKFIDQAQAQIQGLKDALEKQDCETLRTEAHRIRGGAANLTALPLARAAENLEEIAGSNLIDQAHEKVEELEQEFVRLKNFVCNLKLQGKG